MTLAPAVPEKTMSHPTLCAITTITPERKYITPATSLRDSISHYTVFTPQSGESPGSLTIVPDASGSIVCVLAEGPEASSIETWFWGPSSRAVEVEHNPEKYPLYIMIEFLPCGANRLLGIPMSELHNTIIPLYMIDLYLHKILLEIMEQLERNPHDIESVCSSLDATFLRLFVRNRKESALVRHVIGEVRRTNGTLRMGELSRQIGCSTRCIERTMFERLGMSTKSLARIIRVNAACRGMDSSSISFTELAYSLNYHDQSHFIRDFTDICGVTPGEYRLRMSHFYNEELKFGAIVPKK